MSLCFIAVIFSHESTKRGSCCSIFSRMLRPQFVLLIWPKCCCCGNTHKGPTLRQTISGFSARLTPKKMLGNFVKMTKQNKTDNYSSLRSLWSPQTTRGDALSSETIGDSFTFTQTSSSARRILWHVAGIPLRGGVHCLIWRHCLSKCP